MKGVIVFVISLDIYGIAVTDGDDNDDDDDDDEAFCFIQS